MLKRLVDVNDRLLSLAQAGSLLKRLVELNDRLLAWAQAGSLWLARLGGLLLIATVVMITLNIATRSLLDHSLLAATEFSGYVLAICASWAFAYALLCKAHVRIDVAYLQFPQVLRAMMDIIALIAWLLFSIVVTRAAWGVAAESFSRGSLSNTPMKTPLWIPQTLWVLGLVWFGIVVVLLLARVLLAVLSRNPETIQFLVGSSTLDEQIRNEGGDP